MPQVRTLRRALGVLTVVAAGTVFAAWLQATHAQDRGLGRARALFLAGTPQDLRAAADALAVARTPGDCLASAEALVRAQLWAEFGEDAAAVEPALAAAAPEAGTCADLTLAHGVAALARGDVAAARAALAEAPALTGGSALLVRERLTALAADVARLPQ